MDGGASLGLDGLHLSHLEDGSVGVVDHAERRPNDRLVGEGVALDHGTLGQLYDADSGCQFAGINHTLQNQAKVLRSNKKFKQLSLRSQT